MSEINALIKDLCPNGVAYSQLGAVTRLVRGQHITKELCIPGPFPVVSASREALDFHKAFNHKGDAVSISSHGAYAGFISFWANEIWLGNNVFLFETNPQLQAKFLYYVLKSRQSEVSSLAKSGGVPYINASQVQALEIPIPPLEVQAELVRILDTFTSLEAELEAELEARKKQYLAIGRKLLPLTSSSTNELWASLGDVVQIKNGSDWKTLPPGDVPVFGSGGVIQHVGASVHSGPSVLIPRKGSIGNIFYVDRPFWTVDTCFYTEINMEKADPRFLYHYLLFKELASLNVAGGVPSLTQTILKTVPFPLIELNQQQEIAQKLDAISDLIESPDGGLAVELTARRKQYEYYRDQLLTFKEA